MKSLSTTHIKELNHPTIKETNKLTLSYHPTNKLQILNQFEIIKEIGTGMHSRVKLGYDLMAQKPIAIKIMNRKEKKRSKFTVEQNAKIRQEINCLKRINNNHNNIVKLFEVLDDFQSRKIYLILEYCPRGEIKWCNDTDNELDARGPPRWSFQRVREMIRDVILGLEYLHNKGIIHRDIKPANLLIAKNNTIKISDFSISLILNHTASTEHNDDDDFLQIIKTEGTPAFFAPEICLGADVEEKFNISSSSPSPSPSPVASPQDYLISTKIDVWALGITAYCLLFGMLPFTSKFELKLFDKIVNQPLEFPEYVTLLHNNVSLPASIQEYELAKDFISSLLIKNPLQRSSIDDCKNHRFICFDFNNNLINDQRTKDVKLQQKLKFLTKQVISCAATDENNSNNNSNNNNDFIYTEDMDSNAHCDMDSFLSPIASPATSEGDNSSISRSNTPTNTLIRSKKSNEKNKYNRNHRNKNKQTHTNDNTMVHLPINSSFASLDSFYIENFAMSKLNQDDPSIFNNKFKSSSQPVMDYSPKHSQTDLVVPRTRRRGKHRQKDPNTFNIDSGSANNSAVYLDDNSNKSNSSIRVNVHDLNSQPSSRVPSNNKLSQNNSSGFSSNVSMSSNGSMHRELFKGRVSPHIPFHNDSLPKLSSIDKVLDPSAHTSTDKKKKKKNCKRTDRHIDKFAYNELYTSTNENRTTSAVDSDKSLNMSNFSSSPTQPSYYVTSEDASVVSLRNLPHFSNMIPPETIASLMASSNSASSLTTSRSSSSISSSSSSSFSESNSNSINHSGDFESDSGEELILNIGNSGHMRRRQSQYTSKLEQQTNDASIELSQSNRTLPCSPIRLKRNSSSSSQHFGSLSARPSATNLLQTNTINEDNIMTESFISGEIDSRMLLKDVLDNTPSNNKQQ